MYLYGLEIGLTLLLSLLGFGVVIFAQIKISSAYSKYKNVASNCNLSGCEIARKILDANGLNNIHVVEVRGELSDHYDPSRKVVRLSTSVFHGTSIASISVAAHECGHAIQDKENYTFMVIRSKLVPFVNIVSYLGYFISIFAFIAGVMQYLTIGILVLLATILFQLVTLPVEFDASTRARRQLEVLGIINTNEQDGVKDVLGAAAMTYVASLLSSLLNLLRLVIMFSGRDND